MICNARIALFEVGDKDVIDDEELIAIWLLTEEAVVAISQLYVFHQLFFCGVIPADRQRNL